MLIQIKDSTTKAEARQAEAEAKEKELEVDSARIAIEKQEAEAALEEALPALAEAAEALDNLRKEDITELRRLRSRAARAGRVLVRGHPQGLQGRPLEGSKLMMNESNFLRSLVEFEKDSLTDKQIKQVKQFFQQADFTPEAARDKSMAAAGLLKWVYAIVNYYGVAKTVNPKRQAVAQAEKSLRQASKDLAKIKEEVKFLAAQLLELNEEYEQGSAEENELPTKAARWRASSTPRRS